jgi:hypothetical protein
MERFEYKGVLYVRASGKGILKQEGLLYSSRNQVYENTSLGIEVAIFDSEGKPKKEDGFDGNGSIHIFCGCEQHKKDGKCPNCNTDIAKGIFSKLKKAYPSAKVTLGTQK